ncbi:MAG TPA: aspartate--tRNA ligase, partial [Candidatus Kapabacteria bacterium]|nr:aspartate--tRNA ligase [Candidatus Kapabacteria bacterium]
MTFTQRTHTCGELRIVHIGSRVTLNGWVASQRDLGAMVFVDVRDRYGITQVVFDSMEKTKEEIERSKTKEGILAEMEEMSKAIEEAESKNIDLTQEFFDSKNIKGPVPKETFAFWKSRKLRNEYVISVSGVVRKREKENPNLPTGQIEILADTIKILNSAETPPIEIGDDSTASEEQRLKYRYLDLRRQSLQEKFIVRNKVYQVVHRYFGEHNFIEVETPVMMKSTPEGARDFLVPSRIHKGKFYALPQSPQIYKQLLMVSGFDRYVQIVKCFRDEDLRADRQPEFSQIDVEMSFVTQEDILTLAEGFTKELWKEVLGMDIVIPFRRMTFEEAMRRYGSDKPDARFAMELYELTDEVKGSEFKVFQDIIAANGSVAALNAKGCAKYSRKDVDTLTELAKRYGAKGLSIIKYLDGKFESPIAKYLSEEIQKAILQKVKAENGDLILIAADEWERCHTILGQLRLEIARREKIMDAVKDKFDFLFVVDFPLLEFSPEDNRYVARHHPFTTPKAEDLHLFEKDPGKMRADAYDLVINGAEIGGGSLRIYRREIQEKMFNALGFSKEEAEKKFGFLLGAFRYGAPPHGGIAFG